MQQYSWNLIFLIICSTILACQSGADVEGVPLEAINNNNLRLTEGRVVAIPGSEDPNVSVFYLVRHAEKKSDGDNPILTDEGMERSNRLATILANTQLDLCYSTNYNRTMMTAEPIAKLKNLEIIPYDPRDLEAFSQKLKIDAKLKRSLIIGHSNTTPALVNLLSGNTVYENINEQEYSDFFVVSLQEGKPAKVLKLKY